MWKYSEFTFIPEAKLDDVFKLAWISTNFNAETDPNLLAYVFNAILKRAWEVLVHRGFSPKDKINKMTQTLVKS